MDTRDGRIYTPEETNKMFGEVLFMHGMMFKRVMYEFEERKHFIPMEIAPTPKQLARRPPKVGRNEPCPCGSGKKFKKCCLAVNTEKRPEPDFIREA